MDPLAQLANWFGSAVCHQMVSHSYVIAGVPLCLCAHCTGMYLGAFTTFLFLTVRYPRAMRLPRPSILLAFLVFFALWGGDGINSLLAGLPGAAAFYPPDNRLRLVSGMLMGIAFGSIIFVMFNALLWQKWNPLPLYANPLDLLLLLGLNVLLVWSINAQWEWLLYPLTAVLLASIVGLNSLIWTALLASVVGPPRREHAIWWRFAVGTGAALLLLIVLAAGRVWLGLAGAPL
jgi:uncharacterized membrane protein